MRKKPPELSFQRHVADFLVREHGYGVLEQSDITDTEHCIAEDQLWAFLTATQADALKQLGDDYGTDARAEVFKALRRELAHTPMWMLLRHGLKVRALELRLFTRNRALPRAQRRPGTARTASTFARISISARPGTRSTSSSF